MTPTMRNNADLNSACPMTQGESRERGGLRAVADHDGEEASWLTVPNARMRLRSVSRSAWMPPSSIVTMPRVMTIGRHVVLKAKIGCEAGDEVDAGLDHRGRVQIGAHRRGSGHGAGKPEVEGEQRPTC